jgi:hypothetical protein
MLLLLLVVAQVVDHLLLVQVQVVQVVSYYQMPFHIQWVQRTQ